MSGLPKVGIVGNSEYIVLLAPLLKAEGFPLTAVWCKNRETSQVLADKFSVAHCPASFQELLVLRDVDLVYVATEPLRQAEITVKALTSGKHCVCVKPPSVSLEEVYKMLVLTRYYPQLYSVLESPMSFIPSYLNLKKIIKEGVIGEVTTINVNMEMGSLIGTDSYSWKCDPSLGGGVLNLVGSHIIGAVCNIGEKFCNVKRLNCMLKTINKTSKKINGYRTILSDDYCSLQLEMVDDVIVNIVINSLCEGHYAYQMSVNGSKGRATIKGLDLYLQEHGDKQERLIHKEDISSVNQHYYEEAQKNNLPFEYYYSMVVGSKRFLFALRELFTCIDSDDPRGKSFLGLSSFEDAHHIRAVLDTARVSAKQYRWVDTPPSKERPSFASNPFWPSSVKIDIDKPLPKSHDPVSYV